MNCNKYPGSRWWRFDFHTHTPESRDYGRGEQVEISKREWLLQHMRAGLQCVAVTDHNTGGWVDGLAAELETLRREAEEGNPAEGYAPLFLFPGVEISVSGDLHLLALFPPDTNGQHIANIVHECGYWGTPGDSDAVTSRSIFDTVDCVLRNGGIPIPAHADGPKGLFVGERPSDAEAEGAGAEAQGSFPGGRASDVKGLAKRHVAAMELLDPAFTPPQVYRDLKLEWAVVQGSDSHHPREVGRRSCWVKMGDPPTFEGLKLALWDGQESVLLAPSDPQGPNRHSPLWIQGLTIQEAQYAGRRVPLELRFSPWFTTLVGGRGSGKSTVVEFLRTALHRTKELGPEMTRAQKKYWSVPERRGDPGALTANSRLTVDYCRDGRLLRAHYDNGPESRGLTLEEVDEAGAASPSPGEIRDRCPVRMFSQNQIFELSEEPQGLMHLVDDSAQVQGAAWRAQWEEEQATFLRLRAQAREAAAKLKELEPLRGRLQDVLHRQAVFEKQGSRDLYRSYHRKRRQRGLLEGRLDFLRDAVARVEAFAGELSAPAVSAEDFPTEGQGNLWALQFLQRTDEALAEVRASLEEAAIRLQVLANREDQDFAASEWTQEEKAVLSAYQAFQEALHVEPGQSPPDFGKLVAERQALEKQIQELEAQKRNEEDFQKHARSSLQTLLEFRRELTDRRRSFLQEVLGDNQMIRMRIVPYGDRSQAETSFRDLLGMKPGTLEGDVDSGDRGVVADLYREEATDGATMEERLANLKSSLQDMAQGATVDLAVSKWFVNRVQALQPEVLDRLDLWFPEDGLEVEYLGGGRSRGFVQSSPGERAAGILAFVLAHGEEPLILDQPENDLDNHVIYDLVAKQIRQTKKRRQVILVTHNPNLVVHADAELVTVLAMRGGQVRPDRSDGLHDKTVREKICEVMEGGRKALQERYHRLIEVDGDV